MLIVLNIDENSYGLKIVVKNLEVTMLSYTYKFMFGYSVAYNLKFYKSINENS
jgi:hypothetical protein